jgi:hypothetical protein
MLIIGGTILFFFFLVIKVIPAMAKKKEATDVSKRKSKMKQTVSKRIHEEMRLEKSEFGRYADIDDYGMDIRSQTTVDSWCKYGSEVWGHFGFTKDTDAEENGKIDFIIKIWSEQLRPYVSLIEAKDVIEDGLIVVAWMNDMIVEDKMEARALLLKHQEDKIVMVRRFPRLTEESVLARIYDGNFFTTMYLFKKGIASTGLVLFDPTFTQISNKIQFMRFGNVPANLFTDKIGLKIRDFIQYALEQCVVLRDPNYFINKDAGSTGILNIEKLNRLTFNALNPSVLFPKYMEEYNKQNLRDERSSR